MSLLTNLISYWKLDGNSNDAVGSNNGSDTAITYNAGNGKIVQGAGFNGTTSKIVGANNTNVPLNATIQCWIKTSTIQVGLTFVGGYILAAGGGEFDFVEDNSGYFNVRAWDTDGVAAISVSSGSLADGNWHHLVGVLSTPGGAGTTSTVTLYVDGQAQTADTDTFTGNFNTMPFKIAIQQHFAYYFTGALDEVGYWSRALTSGEVTSLWNGGAGLAYPLTTNVVYTMVTAPATFTLTGMASGFKTVRKMITAPATFILTGMSVFISKSGIIKPIIELVNIIKPKLNSSINKIKITIVNSLKPKLH
jgi:hypothetical protein